MTSPQPATRQPLYWTLLVLVLSLGIAARVYHSSSLKLDGFDEKFYEHYVAMLNDTGLTGYPKIVAEYLEHQSKLDYSVLPPMRFLYIFAAHLCGAVTGAQPMDALKQVACLFTILTLGVSYLFARRLGGPWVALGVLALMCCSPTQIHMSQHAMVDGFFAFWALLCLWLLWENLQRANQTRWLVAFGLGLMLMVMTKENAFFAYVAMGTIVFANKWAGFGTVTPRLLVVMFIGPLLGVLALMTLAGGLHPFIETYHQSVSKNYTLAYAIKTGDGPWHRYLSDMLLMSPVVLLLALGELFHLRRDSKAGWYLTLFISASYLIMCNVKYGMNLRYTNMWDMPVRYMAFAQMTRLSGYSGSRKNLVLVLLLAGVCAIELRQYWIFFVQHDLYELVSAYLLHALNILK